MLERQSDSRKTTVAVTQSSNLGSNSLPGATASKDFSPLKSQAPDAEMLEAFEFTAHSQKAAVDSWAPAVSSDSRVLADLEALKDACIAFGPVLEAIRNVPHDILRNPQRKSYAKYIENVGQVESRQARELLQDPSVPDRHRRIAELQSTLDQIDVAQTVLRVARGAAERATNTFLNNPTMSFDEKVEAMRRHHFQTVAQAINIQVRSGSSWRAEGELRAEPSIGRPERMEIKGLTVIFPADPDSKFPQEHTWEITGSGDNQGLDLEIWNAKEKLRGASETWGNDDSPSQVANDLYRIFEGLPSDRVERLEERDEVENPLIHELLAAEFDTEYEITRGLRPFAEPDNGPMEPWNVPAWIKRLQADDRLVSLDTETTGIDGTALEVAVVDSKSSVLYHAYVQPMEPIHPAAAEKNGFTEESLAALGARPWVEVSSELREVLRGRAVVQYAFNFFDKEVLERSDELAGVAPTAEGVSWVDAMEPYQHGGALYKGMKLVEAAEDLGVVLRPEDAHGAVADAKAAIEVFNAMAVRKLELDPGEVLVHKGTDRLEAYTALGERRQGVPQDVLVKSLELAKLGWEKPQRALESLAQGAYIRIKLNPVINHWLYDQGKPLTAVRLPLSATNEEVRNEAIRQNERTPLPNENGDTPYERSLRLGRAEVRFFANGT